MSLGSQWNKYLSTAGRIFFIGVLVFILGYVFTRWAFFMTSDQAFINTKLVTLRAPITGILNSYNISVGDKLNEGTPLARMSNPQFGNTDTYINYQNIQNNIDALKNVIEQNKIEIAQYENDAKRLEHLNQTGAAATKDLEDVRKAIGVLQADVRNKNTQLLRLQNNCDEISKQLDLQKKTLVTAPCAGVLWTILAKDGEQLNYGDEIAQMINPQDVWVDAFFSERYASELTPGLPVRIQALGTQRFWDGKIVFVRGGSGRIIYNSAVEMPPTGITSRLVAVRIKVDWKNGYTPAEFYGVGRSLVVVAKRK